MRLLFDRGTILCLDAPPQLEPTTLPGVLWDDRVGGFRAPAWRLPDLLAALERQGVVHEPPTLRAARVDPWSRVETRPYQETAVAAWRLAGRRGQVVLPTGSGKTHVALAAAAIERVPTLILAPTRVLVSQWLNRIAEVYPGSVGCVGDGRRDLEAITVATFESAVRHMAWMGDRFQLLVVDESHHFGRGGRDEALEMALAPWRLGLSATPTHSPAGRYRVAQLLGPVVYELGISDLMGRYLAPFDVFTLSLDLIPSERRAYEHARRVFRDVYGPFRQLYPESDWREFVKVASKSEAGRRALEAWRRSRELLAFPRTKAEALGVLLERHGHRRVLVFTADNRTAYAVAREHLVMPITCDIGRAERQEALARFAEGSLRVLVSARVLNEGLDVPDADVAVVVGGSAGTREHVQRVGRLLRPKPGKRAVVYELVIRDTTEERQSRERRRGLASPAAAAL